MRILALDVGSKSIGFAISDELEITAQPLENFMFPEKDWDLAIDRVLHWTKTHEVKLIIVGLPTLPSGDESPTTKMIKDFVSLLKAKTNIEIIFSDENMTTKKANNIMIEAGLTRKKRKMHKDKLAAVIILQEYLQYR